MRLTPTSQLSSGSLRDQGLVSDEEFTHKRAEILENL